MSKAGRVYFLSRGFIQAEASAFKNISIEAIKDSKYLKTMVQSRMRRVREWKQANGNSKESRANFRLWVRKLYVSKGFAKSPDELLLRGSKKQRDNARSKAFMFFNAYKDRYAVRDTSGKLIATPRKKTRINKRMITGNKTIDQAIKADKKSIEHYEFMKKFAKTDDSKKDFDKSIKRLEGRIERLKRQKD
jgi:hypothetical protein